MTRRLGDNYRLMPDLPGAYGPPDPPPEGPEVWCRSCQWSHPTNAACIYGRNQPMEVADRFWAKVDRRGSDDCWEWIGPRDRAGYGDFVLKGRHTIAHRVALQLSGIDPTGWLACHRCDNPPCCNPAHLFLGTSADNARDRDAKGRAGERFGRAEAHPDFGKRGDLSRATKVTDAQVAEMRRRHAAGETQASLAAEFDIHPATVSRIVRGVARGAACVYGRNQPSEDERQRRGGDAA